MPPQEDIRLNGHALQCRITTEDPEQNFIPDYGRITAYRGATGFGIRLDGGTAYSGAVITRYYDPLLEKVTAWAPSPGGGDRAHGPGAARVPHPRRRDQPRLPRKRHRPSALSRRELHDALHRRDAGADRRGAAPGPRDQAPELHRRRDRERPSGDARPRRGPTRHAPPPVAPRLRRQAGGRHEAAPRPRRAGSLRALDARRAARARHRHDDARRAPVAARHAHAQLRHRRGRARPMRRRCRSSSRSNAGAARPSTSRCAS